MNLRPDSSNSPAIPRLPIVCPPFYSVSLLTTCICACIFFPVWPGNAAILVAIKIIHISIQMLTTPSVYRFHRCPYKAVDISLRVVNQPRGIVMTPRLPISNSTVYSRIVWGTSCHRPSVIRVEVILNGFYSVEWGGSSVLVISRIHPRRKLRKVVGSSLPLVKQTPILLVVAVLLWKSVPATASQVSSPSQVTVCVGNRDWLSSVWTVLLRNISPCTKTRATLVVRTRFCRWSSVLRLFGMLWPLPMVIEKATANRIGRKVSQKEHKNVSHLKGEVEHMNTEANHGSSDLVILYLLGRSGTSYR